jgi:hypothetical protein
LLEGRVYVAIVSSGACFLLASGLVLNLLTVSATMGPFRILGAGSEHRFGGVAIFLPASKGRQAGPLATWKAIAASGVDIASEHIGELDDGEIRAIVVADASTLTATQQRALLDIASRGVGVLFTGTLGTQADEDTGERLARLLEVDRVERLDPRRARHLVRGAEGALAPGIELDRRIFVASPQPRWGIPTASAAPIEWERPAASGVRHAAAAGKAHGRGRLAWLAISPTTNERGVVPSDQRRLARTALAWLMREPQLEVAGWPGGAARVQVDGQPARPKPAVRTWHASAEDFARWRRLRRALDARVSWAGARRLLVEVTHRGEEPIEKVVLRLHLNAPMSDLRADRTLLRQRLPEVSFQSGDSLVELGLPELPPQARRAYTVDLAPSPPQSAG